MRKLSILIMIILSIHLVVCASAFDATVEELKASIPYQPITPLLPSLGNDCYLTDFNGEQYFFSKHVLTQPIKYDPKAFEFFINGLGWHDYLWTGEYYMARETQYDYAPQSWKGYSEFKLRFYDKDFNLIKECIFDDYILGLGYLDGTYYCSLSVYGTGANQYWRVEKYMKSTDMENWTETTEIPKHNDYISYYGNNVSLDGVNFNKVDYESEVKFTHAVIQADNLIVKTYDTNHYISMDNVYFVNVDIEAMYYPSYIYFTDDFLILDGGAGIPATSRIRIPKQQIYDELEKLKNPIYVQLNETILGFEQLPVVEQDRTLVPMRFLFEQMGEKVEWEGETQTATVIDANSRIAFSIDNNTAEVNSSSKTMDVPARLINGKTMVPLRFLSEELGYTVEWDEQNNIATIRTK